MEQREKSQACLCSSESRQRSTEGQGKPQCFFIANETTIKKYNKDLTIMRKQFYFLLLSVLLSIPLGMKATIVDDPDVFNFAPFYDPSSGVIGLSLTFFPSEEGDTVYIPDYIYENNQYKYVVNINTGAFYDCHAKYIRLPNHLRFIQDYAFHYCCFLTTLEFTNDISDIDFGEIDDIVGGCNYVDEIIVPLEYLSNYIEDPEDRFFPFYLYEQLKSRINMNSQTFYIITISISLVVSPCSR